MVSMSEYREWDEIYRRHSVEDLPWEMGRPREYLVKLVESGKVSPCKTLDLCSGAGTNPVYLASKGFRVTGIDISETAIGMAEKKADEAGVTVEFVQGNFLNLPFREEFDFLVDIGCFHNVREEDRERYLSEVLRVLKKGGKYYLMCFSERNGKAWNHFSREQIEEIFRPYFIILDMEHSRSLENDGIVRYFYNVLMEKR